MKDLAETMTRFADELRDAFERIKEAFERAAETIRQWVDAYRRRKPWTPPVPAKGNVHRYCRG